MKYIVKYLFMALMMCACLTSCRDDAEIPSRGPEMHPEKETEGVYTGVWTRTNLGTEAVETFSGTITLTATADAYISNVALKCSDINLDVNKNVNIAPGASGYIYYNALGVLLPGADKASIFSGNISKAGVIDIFFQATFKEGRKSTSYSYSFEGQKQ